MAGTIFSAGAAAPDEDWFKVTMPTAANRVFGADVVRVRETTEGVEHVATYRVVRASGSAVSLRVTAPANLDVAYQLSVATPVQLTPTVTIEEPVLTAGQTVYANSPVRFRASGTYASSALTVPAVTWAIDGVTQPATALSTTFSRPAGTYTFTASAFGASDSLAVPFVDCTAVVQITSPSANVMRYADAVDANGPYLNVTFTARALDAMGNVIPASSLIFEWTTDRGDLQPGAPTTGAQSLGTGASLGTVRIYCAGGSTQETHVITVRVRSTPGGPVLSTATVRVVVQNLI